jgi:5-methylcytosine-specific restriction endonuclease McrA
MLKVVRRDDYRCRSCGQQVQDQDIEFDHVIPHAKGGPTSVENIRLLCRDCNRKKSDSLAELLDSPPR